MTPSTGRTETESKTNASVGCKAPKDDKRSLQSCLCESNPQWTQIGKEMEQKATTLYWATACTTRT